MDTENVRLVLPHSVLGELVLGGAEYDYNGEEVFDLAQIVFEREMLQAFSLTPLDDKSAPVRAERIRLLILKVIGYLRLKVSGRSKAVLARLIETLALNPELEIRVIFDELAKHLGTTPKAISKIVEKSFFIYDDEFYDRVCKLTCTQPLSAREVLSDIAVYVRIKYFKGLYYAQFHGKPIS